MGVHIGAQMHANYSSQTIKVLNASQCIYHEIDRQ